MRSDARRNRASMVAAARRDLSERGSLSMRRVAMTAGVSRSTLYRHFSTRAALEEALREEALGAARVAIESEVQEDRPPVAVLRRLVEALAGIARESRVDALKLLPLGAEADEAGAAMLPAAERLLQAVELAPGPPAAWLSEAALQFLNACLEAGTGSPDDSHAAAADLFRSLTESLDQGLVLLDPAGSVLSINPRAARVLDPRVEVIYEDGTPCAGDAYPLTAAVQTLKRQRGVRGHQDDAGAVTWMAVDGRPLRRPDSGEVYGFVGILSDVSAEKDWELERLRPAGELSPSRPVPLDLVRIVDEIPPHLFPEQFVSEARRIAGGPVALYVVDIDGSHLLRLAGAEEFPERLEAPLALGPELAEDGMPDLTASLQAELPGVTIAPMSLRGRAIGLLLALRARREPLIELGRLGAAAMELAGGYTDVIDSARRRKKTHAAAELQQSLLPPRIARMGGGEVAGSVLPTYEVGGDWFDYVENRDGAWLAIADATGRGTAAGALGAIALAALRSARRSGQSVEAAAQAMHQVIYAAGSSEFFVTAIIARWHAVYSVFSWINCGHPPPLLLRADDSIEQLVTEPALPLGLFDEERRFSRHHRRLEEGERLILHSDGITARRTADGLFGLDGIERAVAEAGSRSASAIARAIQEAVMAAAEDPLQDDAVAVVLAPTSDPGHHPGARR